jgi:hypothetical protein
MYWLRTCASRRLGFSFQAAVFFSASAIARIGSGCQSLTPALRMRQQHSGSVLAALVITVAFAFRSPRPLEPA